MSESVMRSVKGKANWAKLFEFNRDKADFHTESDGLCSVNVVLEPDELAKLAESGSRLKPKATEEGVEVKFGRKFQHYSIPALGGAPKVVDANDELWDTEKMIGNGTEVEVFFTVYPTKKYGKGTRLEGVRVLNLVEYIREDDGEGNVSDSRLPF